MTAEEEKGREWAGLGPQKKVEPEFLVEVSKHQRRTPEEAQELLKQQAAQAMQYRKTGQAGMNLTCPGLVDADPFSQPLRILLKHHEYKYDRVNYRYIKFMHGLEAVEAEEEWFNDEFLTAVEQQDPQNKDLYTFRGAMHCRELDEEDIDVY